MALIAEMQDVADTCEIYVWAFGGESRCSVRDGSGLRITVEADICGVVTIELLGLAMIGEILGTPSFQRTGVSGGPNLDPVMSGPLGTNVYPRFTTGSDVSTLQMVFETRNQDLPLQIDNARFYFSAGFSTAFVAESFGVRPDTSYTACMSFFPDTGGESYYSLMWRRIC